MLISKEVYVQVNGPGTLELNITEELNKLERYPDIQVVSHSVRSSGYGYLVNVLLRVKEDSNG